MLQEFEVISNSFRKAKYQQGLLAVESLLAYLPHNSSLHLNRALFHSQMERDGQALEELRTAVEISPRNYLSYFNQFSLLYRNQRDQQALKSLCCSISCLLLLRAKKQRSKEDCDRAIRYCHNNVQAHALKGLILLQQDKFLQSYYQFEQATAIDPLNKALFQLRSCAFQRAYPGSLQARDYFYREESTQVDHTLQCSYIRAKNYEEELKDKLSEFNSLYRDVSGDIEAVTTKIDTASTEGRSCVYSQPSQIYKSTVQVQDVRQDTPQQSSVAPQPGQIYMRCPKIEASEFHSCEAEPQDLDKFESVLQSGDHPQKADSKGPLRNDQQEISRIKDLPPSEMPTDELGAGEQKDAQRELQLAGQEEGLLQKGQGGVFQKAESSFNLIYPLDDFSRIRVEVLDLEFSNPAAGMESQLTNIYCIISYNRKKFITFTCPFKEGGCSWGQRFDPAQIAPEPSVMKVKVYNKRYNSVRDQFLGDIEVQITTADLLRLPLFSKGKDPLGFLSLKLELETGGPPSKNEMIVG